LIAKYGGREVAFEISKRFSIEFDFNDHTHFSVFSGLHNHHDQEILASQKFMEHSYASDINISGIAASTSMGLRNFLRRFKSATNYKPLEYLQRIKIEAAKRALENGDGNINNIMRRSGYKDPKTFRMQFRRITGLSPTEYRVKYIRLQFVTKD
jgi:transcriptional regulator GlxA family with amidase domain